MPWFKEPTLLEKLQRQLAEAEAARIEATARVALWKSDEKFRIAEIARLENEVRWLSEAASAVAASEVLEVEVAAEASAAQSLLRRIH